MGESFTCEMFNFMEAEEVIFIPKYVEVFKEVLNRYHDDFRKEGAHSYDYKLNSNR